MSDYCHQAYTEASIGMGTASRITHWSKRPEGCRARFATVAVALLAVAAPSGLARGQEAMVVEFPDPAMFYGNGTFVIDGEVGYVPSYDSDVLWSFSVVTAELLDPDGLALPAPGTSSDPFLFANDLLAIPGWFPNQSIFVADISDPTDLTQVGIISFPSTTNIQGQNVEVDDDGVIGYVAGFPDDTLYSFNVSTLSLEDPDGLSLPGNPDRIARAGDRVAMVDTTNGRILVADVSDPANLTLAGIIELPGSNTFSSNDNIVFAADGRTGFVSTNERVLHSFDVLTLSVLDPDGLTFGSGSFGDHLAIHGDTLACISSRGLSFVDVSDPTNLSLISNANFGGTVAAPGSATVAFTADGTMAAIPIVYPACRVYTFEVATGNQVSPWFAVDDGPNYLTIFGPSDRVGVICSGPDTHNIWLIGELFPVLCVGDLDGDNDTDQADLGILLADWGCTGGHCPGDLDGDGDTDQADLGILLADWDCGT